jgi:putative ABC transport system permease protein
MRDIRFAVRNLTRNPTFTVVSVMTLALGIGATTAIFSVLHAVLLRPLPYPDPGRLVAVHESLPPTADAPDRSRFAVAPPTLRDWDANTTFAGLSAYARGDFILTGGGEPDRIGGASVSWNFFDTMGVPAAAGRFFTREDDAPEAPPVVVLSYDLWNARFGADPTIIGRRIELSSVRHQVIGIAGDRFSFPSAARIWVPLRLPASEFADNQRLSFYLAVVGRLRADVSRAQAEGDLDRIAARVAEASPATHQGRGATVISLHESTVGDLRRPLLLLFGTVLLVLLIACANVANLQLARAVVREGEVAVRVALGATRLQVVRQLLVESALVGLLGATAGVLLALWARDGIVALTPATVPRLAEVRIDPAVLGFAVMLSLVTGVLFGTGPALLATRRGPGLALRAAGRWPSVHGRSSVRRLIVVLELAASLSLLAGAGLLARTFWNLLAVDPGFDARGVMTMEIVLPRAKYGEPEARARFFDTVVESLRANPTVHAAGGTTGLPLAGSTMAYGFYKEGMIPDRDAPLNAGFRGVTPDYFRAIGVPLRRGRLFTREDRSGAPPVMMINEAMAQAFWPGEDPIGRRIAVTRGRVIVWREIVGIVGSVRHAALGAEPAPEMYMPYAHDPFPFLRIAVRSAERPEALAAAMRAAVWAVDPDQPVSRVRPMSEVVAASLAEARFHATLVGSFSLIAFVLAAIGLYGVIAYSVSRRVHEFGVRMALGAAPMHLFRLVMGEGIRLAAAGLAIGLCLAVGFARFLPIALYGTSPLDPAVLGGVAGALALVALLASYLPARRAIATDPLVALRAE